MWGHRKGFTDVYKGKSCVFSQARKSAGSQGQSRHLDEPQESRSPRQQNKTSAGRGMCQSAEHQAFIAVESLRRRILQPGDVGRLYRSGDVTEGYGLVTGHLYVLLFLLWPQTKATVFYGRCRAGKATVLISKWTNSSNKPANQTPTTAPTNLPVLKTASLMMLKSKEHSLKSKERAVLSVLSGWDQKTT